MVMDIQMRSTKKGIIEAQKWDVVSYVSITFGVRRRIMN